MPGRRLRETSGRSRSPSNPGQLSVPDFFIESFRVPPFLLLIYQAAGSASGTPGGYLPAINEVEIDYGRNLRVSSGAEGWDAVPALLLGAYGVDAND